MSKKGKLQPWRVTYQTWDENVHSCVVEARNTVHAVNLAGRDCASKGLKWFKALKAWPEGETEPFPCMRHAAMKELGLKDG